MFQQDINFPINQHLNGNIHMKPIPHILFYIVNAAFLFPTCTQLHADQQFLIDLHLFSYKYVQLLAYLLAATFT